MSAAAFPNFVIPGYASLGGQVARFQTPIRDTQILDSVSYYRGKHAWKAGVEQRWGYNNEIRDRASSGQFTMTPLITGMPGMTGTGDALASFLLGQVNAASVAVSDLIPSHASYSALYVQDEWRVTDRFTLNYGLRWDVEIPRHVAGDRMNSFDPLAINPGIGHAGRGDVRGPQRHAEQRVSTRTGTTSDRGSDSLTGCRVARTTVMRGGGGIFYGPTVSNTIGDAATLGFSTAASYVTSQADLLSATHPAGRASGCSPGRR